MSGNNDIKQLTFVEHFLNLGQSYFKNFKLIDSQTILGGK